MVGKSSIQMEVHMKINCIDTKTAHLQINSKSMTALTTTQHLKSTRKYSSQQIKYPTFHLKGTTKSPSNQALRKNQIDLDLLI